MNHLQLLPANEEDRDFVFNAYKTALHDYVEWAWGWNDDFQSHGFWKNCALENMKLVVIDGRKAGAFYVEESDRVHCIRTLFLLPSFQSQGIGSALLAQEISRARKVGKSVDLKVIKINPAKRLYDRLGFRVVTEDNVTYHMQLV